MVHKCFILAQRSVIMICLARERQFKFLWKSYPQVHQQISALEGEMAALQDSGKLFEASIPENRQLGLFRRHITLLKSLWDIIIYVQVSA